MPLVIPDPGAAAALPSPVPSSAALASALQHLGIRTARDENFLRVFRSDGQSLTLEAGRNRAGVPAWYWTVGGTRYGHRADDTHGAALRIDAHLRDLP